MTSSIPQVSVKLARKLGKKQAGLDAHQGDDHHGLAVMPDGVTCDINGSNDLELITSGPPPAIPLKSAECRFLFDNYFYNANGGDLSLTKFRIGPMTYVYGAAFALWQDAIKDDTNYNSAVMGAQPNAFDPSAATNAWENEAGEGESSELFLHFQCLTIQRSPTPPFSFHPPADDGRFDQTNSSNSLWFHRPLDMRPYFAAAGNWPTTFVSGDRNSYYFGGSRTDYSAVPPGYIDLTLTWERITAIECYMILYYV